MPITYPDPVDSRICQYALLATNQYLKWQETKRKKHYIKMIEHEDKIRDLQLRYERSIIPFEK